MGEQAIGSMKLRDETLDVWQSRMRRRLSAEDARAIAENVVGFFEVLEKWASSARTASPGGGEAVDHAR